MDSLIWVSFLAFRIIFLTWQGCAWGTEIIGGHEVKPHSRPYMASIQMNKQHICGGALIRPRWVLTAAHCEAFWKNREIEVILGAHSFSKRKEEKQQVLKVWKCFPHPNFNWKRKEDDIMLVQLDQAAVLNKYVSTLELPKSTGDVKAGTKCSVAGWGTTDPEVLKVSDTLREVNITIVRRKRCNSEKYYNYDPFITKDMLCAGDEKARKDSCKWDSGGPLMCRANMFSKKYIYRGIVSAGDDCAKPKKPGIYTRLSERFLKWINKTMKVRTIDYATFSFVHSGRKNKKEAYYLNCEKLQRSEMQRFQLSLCMNRGQLLCGSKMRAGENLKVSSPPLKSCSAPLAGFFGYNMICAAPAGPENCPPDGQRKCVHNAAQQAGYRRANPSNGGPWQACNNMKKMLNLSCMVLLVLTILFFTLQVCVCTEIIGGRVIKPHSRPYMVSIQVNKQHICGGALITPRWVLTAAHCDVFSQVGHCKVLLGAHSLTKLQKGKKTIKVLKTFPHPNFDEETAKNDLMLLQLVQAAVLNKYVSTLELPKSTGDVKAGTKCSVAGWGTTDPEVLKASDTLREVNITIVPRKRCNSEKYYNYDPFITKDMLCAGDSRARKDSCAGDSGGPLICTMKNKKKEYKGIVSGGGDCGEPTKPGIYTRLSKQYLNWITKLIRIKNYNMTKDQIYNCMEIIGGQEAVPHSKPYMASIQFNRRHKCGGALIQTNWVLTAAHCQIFPKYRIQVVLGAHSLSKRGKEQQIFTVQRMIPHQLYDSKLLTNDIMLLELKGTATLNKFVNVLKLPTNGKDVKKGAICNVAGWGYSKLPACASDTLQEVNVTVIDRDVCSEYYTYHPAISWDVLCAGDKMGGRDSCKGDSGGPLLCNGNYNGIVSFGCGCAIAHKPGVYTRLSESYLPWIKRIIQS
ncbi:transmembrane protease serine 9-like [Mustelus asterias]